MTLIMILAGALSTMNVWAASLDDIRFSVNDLFMILFMTGWMLLFMMIYFGDYSLVGIPLVLLGVTFYWIRNQTFVTENQFLRGMIPHHSMAVHMSRQLQKKPNQIGDFLQGIIDTQEKEIAFMKRLL